MSVIVEGIIDASYLFDDKEDKTNTNYWFKFMHHDNTDFLITGVIYMSSQEFGQHVKVFNWNTMENDVYDTHLKYLDK